MIYWCPYCERYYLVTSSEQIYLSKEQEDTIDALPGIPRSASCSSCLKERIKGTRRILELEESDVCNVN
jgi:hypothetical protein